MNIKKSIALFALLSSLLPNAFPGILLYRQLPELAPSSRFKIQVKQGDSGYSEIFAYQIGTDDNQHVTEQDLHERFGLRDSLQFQKRKIGRQSHRHQRLQNRRKRHAKLRYHLRSKAAGVGRNSKNRSRTPTVPSKTTGPNPQHL